eukprot:TRINITY_DN3171_c0_g1_i4.p1 TRINITY_DN3171_c0_g1~~TRINITY_DN3171_c0_g1_i4.p1  ORF type:complete len:139 (-),score=16.35 TRINITY_DN3171_c0_g1_i4:112-528(-)
MSFTFFNTWFLAISYDQCLGVNLSGGEFIIKFSNDYYHTIFFVLLCMLILFCCCFPCFIVIIGLLAIQSVVFSGVYAIYSLNPYIQAISIASVIITVAICVSFMMWGVDQFLTSSRVRQPNQNQNNAAADEERQPLQQ